MFPSIFGPKCNCNAPHMDPFNLHWENASSFLNCSFVRQASPVFPMTSPIGDVGRMLEGMSSVNQVECAGRRI